MASLSERIYMDLMARGKDIETARYIDKYLHRQSYHVRKYIMVLVGCSPAGYVGHGGLRVFMAFILTRSILVY